MTNQSKNIIRYKYALNLENQLVNAGELERTPNLKNQVFTCISCGKFLIPKLGKIRQKHFAHKYVGNCSEETYLHRLVKTLFIREYQKCLDFQIPFCIELDIDQVCNTYESNFGIICKLGNVKKIFDLTKRYTSVFLEIREGEFIPDILLSNDLGSKKLFIEIAVTHSLTEKKANSLFNIIEIQIKSESDVDFIYQRLISQSDPKVKFINFLIKPEITNQCQEIKCSLNDMVLFVVYKSHKSLMMRGSLTEIYLILQKQSFSIIYHEIFHYYNDDYYGSESDLYIQKVINAYLKGIQIKNCFLCRYHGINYFFDGEGPIFCKFLKIKCNSNNAAKCNFYKPDLKCFG